MIRTIAFVMAAALSSWTAMGETPPPGTPSTTPPGQPPTDLDMPVSPHQEQTYRPLETQGPRFKELDRNSDGLISMDEAKANPELSGQWKKFDENGDGQLDPVEFAKFEQGARKP
jgi:hypothetical protein